MCARPTRRSRIGPPPAAESYLRYRRASSRPAARPARRRCIPATASSRRTRPSPRRSPPPGSPSSARPRTPSPRWATRSSRRSWRRRPASRPCRVISTPSPMPRRAVSIARDIGYPVMIKAAAGGGGKGMRIAAQRRRDARGLPPARSNEARVQLWRRPRLPREIHRGAAPHRDPGAGRRARQRRPSGRARMLDPAPPPEGHRGGAEPVPRRQDPRARWASRRWRWRARSATARPARSSSSSIASAISTSSK